MPSQMFSMWYVEYFDLTALCTMFAGTMLDITPEVLAPFQKSTRRSKVVKSLRVTEAFNLHTSYLVIRRAKQNSDETGFETEPESYFFQMVSQKVHNKPLLLKFTFITYFTLIKLIVVLKYQTTSSLQIS